MVVIKSDFGFYEARKTEKKDEIFIYDANGNYIGYVLADKPSPARDFQFRLFFEAAAPYYSKELLELSTLLYKLKIAFLTGEDN